MEDLDANADADQPLLDIDDIIRGLQANNSVQRPPPDAPEPIAE